MANKKTPTEGLISSFDKLNDLLDNTLPDGGMMDVNPIAKIDEWIGTGWYILNAVFSGSLFGGMPNRRSVAFAGAEQCGKTFLAMSILRNAQKMGYYGIYCDSEGSIDIEFTKRLGVDPSKVRLQPVNTIEEMNYMMARIVNSFEETLAKKQKPPKIIVILDSLGNLTSLKEKTDSLSGSDKRDMTKQQGIRKMFRVNGLKFAKLGIPFIVNAHVYDAMSMFTDKTISGGGGLKYNASIIMTLTKGKLDEKDDKESAEIVKAKQGIDEKTKLGIVVYVKPFKQRFARPIPVQIHIPFYKKPNPYVGLDKFLNWKDFGIVRGKLLNEKEYTKLEDKEKKKCFLFNKNKKKEIIYVYPSETSRSIVVKHLEKAIPLRELFTDKVFTQKLLKDMDEKIIKPTFTLPDIHSLEELAELEKELYTEEELKGNEEIK